MVAMPARRFLPPSFGRRWREAPEVGLGLFSSSEPLSLRAFPFQRKGIEQVNPYSSQFLLANRCEASKESTQLSSS